jgi:hypothetical protein
VQLLLSDIGIILEIIGFGMLLFVAGRATGGGFLKLEGPEFEKTWYGKLCDKVPEKYAVRLLPAGIGFVITGLVLQLSPFN